MIKNKVPEGRQTACAMPKMGADRLFPENDERNTENGADTKGFLSGNTVP